jgi:hypothetical protein
MDAARKNLAKKKPVKNKPSTGKGKWTQAQDNAFDKKKSIKEGSKGDKKQDKAHGISKMSDQPTRKMFGLK